MASYRKILERNGALNVRTCRKTRGLGGEVIPGRSGEYIILQDRCLIEKARTYDEATRKGKVVKRRHPEAKVEIQCSGVTAELK
jgi:hypothetical protein